MHDSGVVASIVADDSGGLAEAYDTNADPLYQYCLRLLGDPAGAEKFSWVYFAEFGSAPDEEWRAW